MFGPVQWLYKAKLHCSMRWLYFPVDALLFVQFSAFLPEIAISGLVSPSHGDSSSLEGMTP